MKKNKLKTLFILHLLLMVYSLSTLCSKFASQYEILSFKFCLFYFLVLFFLFIYALGWQQVLKHLDLTTAYANKAVTIIWGIIWGAVFFNEGSPSLPKLIGALLVMAGVVVYALADKGESHE